MEASYRNGFGFFEEVLYEVLDSLTYLLSYQLVQSFLNFVQTTLKVLDPPEEPPCDSAKPLNGKQ